MQALLLTIKSKRAHYQEAAARQLQRSPGFSVFASNKKGGAYQQHAALIHLKSKSATCPQRYIVKSCRTRYTKLAMINPMSAHQTRCMHKTAHQQQA
jgi:hypothetical protein